MTDTQTIEETATATPTKAKRAFVLTPYQATKIMNVARAELGLKAVNSPMIYIYANKGAFKTQIADDGTGRKVIDEDSFLEWMNAHNAKQANPTKKVTKKVTQTDEEWFNENMV